MPRSDETWILADRKGRYLWQREYSLLGFILRELNLHTVVPLEFHHVDGIRIPRYDQHLRIGALRAIASLALDDTPPEMDGTEDSERLVDQLVQTEAEFEGMNTLDIQRAVGEVPVVVLDNERPSKRPFDGVEERDEFSVIQRPATPADQSLCPVRYSAGFGLGAAQLLWRP